MTFHEQVYEVLSEITEMLIAKNEKYGNSALEPLGVFSKLSAKEGLLVRIDDKLKRIKNGSLDKDDEDVINDLIGYLVLLKIQTNSKYEPNEDLKAAAEKYIMQNNIIKPVSVQSNGITSSLGQSTTTNVSANGYPIDGFWSYTNSKPTQGWREMKEKQELIKKMQQELRDEMI